MMFVDDILINSAHFRSGKQNLSSMSLYTRTLLATPLNLVHIINPPTKTVSFLFGLNSTRTKKGVLLSVFLRVLLFPGRQVSQNHRDHQQCTFSYHFHVEL